MKTLFILGALIILVLILRVLMRRNKIASQKQKPVEQMLACSYCNLHIPAAEAIQHHGKAYCCREHQRLAER